MDVTNIDMSRPSKLNFIMDDNTNNVIWGFEELHLPAQDICLLKSVAIFVGNEYMTFNTGDRLQLWVHQHLAN